MTWWRLPVDQLKKIEEELEDLYVNIKHNIPLVDAEDISYYKNKKLEDKETKDPS